MQIELTGFLNYKETPVEEGWVRAATESGLIVPRPEPKKLYGNFSDEPIISRTAANGKGVSSYERWLDQDRHYYATPQNRSEGVYLETVVRYLDDVTQTHETVGFSGENMNIVLFFYSGGLGSLSDGYLGKGPLTIPSILKRQGIQVSRDEMVEESDVEMLRAAIRINGLDYNALFKLFLDELMGK